MQSAERWSVLNRECKTEMFTCRLTYACLAVYLGLFYLTDCVNIPGQDGLKIDDLARHSQLLLSHARHFSHHVDLKSKKDTFEF